MLQRFAAVCPECGWVGTTHTGPDAQLAALRQFDHHQQDCVPREDWYELCQECGHAWGDHGRSMMHMCPDGCEGCAREAIAHVNTSPIRVHGTEVRYVG